jgi:hypothetical protein
MTSLDARLSALELSQQAAAKVQPLTDVERAVRLMHLLDGPASPRRTRLVEFLQSAGTGETLHRE